MTVQAGNSTDQEIATLAEAEWQQLGINVHIQTASPSAYINSVEGHKVQSYVRLDGPGVLDPGYYLAYDMACDEANNNNLSATCIPAADKLLNQARASNSAAHRQQLYNQITKLWTADSPKIPVYAVQNVAVLKKNVTGYVYGLEPTWLTIAGK